jgi:hypothetical protein
MTHFFIFLPYDSFVMFFCSLKKRKRDLMEFSAMRTKKSEEKLEKCRAGKKSVIYFHEM